MRNVTCAGGGGAGGGGGGLSVLSGGGVSVVSSFCSVSLTCVAVASATRSCRLSVWTSVYLLGLLPPAASAGVPAPAPPVLPLVRAAMIALTSAEVVGLIVAEPLVVSMV